MVSNYSVKDVYDIWQDMGLVKKDNMGDWVITELGNSIGGKMSHGEHLSVPIFDAEMITDKMIQFCKNKGIK